jgi:protein-tyrosine phosphatase
MRKAASRRGYSLESLARQVLPDDIHDFDLIIVMDHVNLKDLAEIAGGPYHHVRLLGSFLANADTPEKILPVPDPYYGGAVGFERVLDMIEAVCPAILDYCLELLQQKTDGSPA